MITEKITCDICKAERGIDNHWFLVDIISPELTIEEFGPRFLVLQWYDYRNIKDFKHICSSDCIAKLINKIFFSKKAKDANTEGSNISSIK
jgi:hypothetical protein